jgi:protein O-GlcNAc transferase
MVSSFLPVDCDIHLLIRAGLRKSLFPDYQRSVLLQVFCYALSQSDGSEWRQRISAEAEHFVDVSTMSSDSIAHLICDDQIQILVNLNGYTKGARNEIFAMQPVPIQVSYMGFPGTTGAEYIDYLVTDELVSPTQYSHIYSEKLVHLPHCYFVNDYKQVRFDIQLLWVIILKVSCSFSCDL